MTHLGGGGKDLCDVVDAVEVWDQLQPQVDLGTRAWRTELEWAERTLDGLWTGAQSQGRTANNIPQKERKKVPRLGQGKATVKLDVDISPECVNSFQKLDKLDCICSKYSPYFLRLTFTVKRVSECQMSASILHDNPVD